MTNIGGVGGCSFKKECGYNGFAYEGEVIGEIVMGFTHTCWGFGRCRYNYEALTVYLKMDEESLTTIIPAQEEVFSGMGFSG